MSACLDMPGFCECHRVFVCDSEREEEKMADINQETKSGGGYTCAGVGNICPGL